MRSLTAVLLGFSAVTLAARNLTMPEYRLKACLKPGQEAKTKFDGSWLSSYHVGAGQSDATFLMASKQAQGIKGYLSPSNVTSPNGTAYYNQLFDLGTTFPWGFVMDESVNFYAAWEPVRIVAGATGSGFEVAGFFLNATGLQWTSDPTWVGGNGDAFGGWLICDWWHGVPQLFFRIKYYTQYYNFTTPASCADVTLQPIYV